jgi:hypothetical protein
MIIILGLIILVAALIAGVAGAPGGGWAATRLPPGALTLNGVVNLSTWLTAITGAAILLLAYHLATGRPGGRMATR